MDEGLTLHPKDSSRTRFRSTIEHDRTFSSATYKKLVRLKNTIPKTNIMLLKAFLILEKVVSLKNIIYTLGSC
jgi:hypothetical protein